MNQSAGRRTWEEASSPAAVHLARKYVQAWRDSDNAARRPDLRAFLGQARTPMDEPGARLALLRADMTLRWESGEKVGAQWYLDRYSDLGEDTVVALIYEEFCLREEDRGNPDPADYLSRFAQVAGPLRRVLEIHELVGSDRTATVLPFSLANGGASGSDAAFPEAGQTIAGFSLVEELGRGTFARVFLARERQLADRPVALKVARRGSHEPQTLARLQHTHIVPVHSHGIDAATGLHLLCMPYFGRVTLARILADPEVQAAATGAALVEALDRLEPAGVLPAGPSTGRAALERRSYPRAIAWWGARLAEALDHAHDRGVLHRDIKPSNVLVTSDGMPMLLDFNLAREPVLGDGTADATATLGGTIDYMPPEHLKAIAEGTSDLLDGRGDIYGLGVVLFEAVTGKRPFAAARRGASVVEILLRAADERLRPLPRLRDRHPEIPPALEAVIRHSMEPHAGDRYVRAAELAEDLQAVADDLPLCHAREPWPSRATGWIRRRQRRLAAALAILLAVTVVLAAAFSFLNERFKDYKLVQQEFTKGSDSLKNGDYPTAKVHFDATTDLADRLDLSPWGYLAKLRSFRHLGSQLTDKLQELPSGADLEEIKAKAQEKSQLAERIGHVRSHADALFQAADGLRFRLLLGEGRELTRASRDLQAVLAPFYVLESADWTRLDHTLTLLDGARRDRLLVEVNELLFLWMAAIDESLAFNGEAAQQRRAPPDQQAIARAQSICERAIVWVETKGPWLALEARLQAHRAHFGGGQPSRDGQVGLPSSDLPLTVTEETSALACYQWGLLCYRDGRRAAAIDWLQRAAWLRWDNYWYHFLLAYLEDKAGYVDDALKNYSVAAALKPESPGVRFSRARLYRSRGRWDWALEDITSALEKLSDKPEAAQVHLELGYLYQELGNFAGARSEYDLVIASDQSGTYARAARLNRANIDAESAAVDRARQEYDALLLLDPRDTAARHSRALLELRIGRAESALLDLTALLEMSELRNRDEVLAARALALLLLARATEAVADATLAQRLRPSPAHERLRQRSLLAARQCEVLQLDRPEDLALLPLGGRRLSADLRAAADGLDRLARSRPEETYRASLSQAVILAALGERDAAVAAAKRALDLSPYSPRAYLIRGRVRAFLGDRRGAWDDVERGLSIQFNEPGLLELRGVLRAAAGDPRRALEDYKQALVSGALDRIHLHTAPALVALGQVEAAVREWSLALRRDPELPEAYLGRARAQMQLHRWDLALADLEQAASWAHADPRIELGIVAAYFQCLGSRPDRLPRWLDLARRTAGDVWGVLLARSQKPAPPG